MSCTEPSPSSTLAVDNGKQHFEFEFNFDEDEKQFYLKAFPNVEQVRERRTHCTVCRVHLGTAPVQQPNIKMHPILRVTLCAKCFDFYNTGEFSKGEDGSELYCRWCGQGGEVYCCSKCPFVFCKSCIVKNLERGVVSDIEKNENWNCFRCSPKILWPLRAQHWALMSYMLQQKREILALNLSEEEKKQRMSVDNCTCCRLAKSRASNLSSSMESLGSSSSRTSDSKAGAKKIKAKITQKHNTEHPAKRIKENNDEVVCTPDLQSMLEPDCQLTTGAAATTPRTTPPPLVLRNSSIQIRSVPGNFPTSSSPVYHIVNGFRIDLNSAAQKGIYTLPNGKMIQVKRTGVAGVNSTPNAPNNGVLWSRPCDMRPVPTLQQKQTQSNSPQLYNSQTFLPNTNSSPLILNSNANQNNQGANVLKRHVFPPTPVGQARSGLQDKIISAQIIYQHFNNKLLTFCNSNAYKQAKNYHDVKDLYITLSYMCTYTMSRMQGLQNEILEDMRQLGFGSAATNLQNKQYGLGDCDKFENFERDDDIDVMKAKKRKIVDFDDFEQKSSENEPSMKRRRKNCYNDNDEDTKENNEPTQPIENTMDFDVDLDDELDNDDDLDTGDISNSAYRFDSPTQTFADSRVRGHGTEESMRREEQSHAYDRKLTRLIEQYPSIWCTMHPDYGNFEVTRKQWRTIAVHFKRSENIKLRWKNIRKRYVRIERRVEDGKRFTGYFDKATNFLSNRNLPVDQWKPVDCGEDDGDTFARENLDALEETISNEAKEPQADELQKHLYLHKKNLSEEQNSGRPIEVLPIDLKIINFVKRNPVLWRRANAGDMHNQMTVRNLWQQLWRSMSGISFDDMIYRWHYLYEMYKAFRLKKIKNTEVLTNLELKYSKYLAKLYFLYKIDEQVMKSECTMLNDDLYELDVISEHLEFDADEFNKERLQDAKDDKAFVQALVRTVKAYPALWTMQTLEYNDATLRSQLWNKVAYKLSHFKRDLKTIKLRWLLIKYNYYRYCRDYASGCTTETLKFCNSLPIEELLFLNEHRFHRFQNKKEEPNADEIQIIEPKTDTITIDSDDENTTCSPPKKVKEMKTGVPIKLNKIEIKKLPTITGINIGNRPMNIVPVVKSVNMNTTIAKSTPSSTIAACPTTTATVPNVSPLWTPVPIVQTPAPMEVNNSLNLSEDDMMLATQSILASMLEVEIEEPAEPAELVVKPQPAKKQPRKKTTNKDNPAKTCILQRERLEYLKKNDKKLKAKCEVRLTRVDEDVNYAECYAKLKQAQQEAEKSKIEDDDIMIVDDDAQVEPRLDENEIMIINDPIPENEDDFQENTPYVDLESVMPYSTISIPPDVDDMKENTDSNAANDNQKRLVPISEINEANKTDKSPCKEIIPQQQQQQQELCDKSVSSEISNDIILERISDKLIEPNEPEKELELQNSSYQTQTMEEEPLVVNEPLIDCNENGLELPLDIGVNELDALLDLPTNVSDDQTVKANEINEMVNEHTYSSAPLL